MARRSVFYIRDRYEPVYKVGFHFCVGPQDRFVSLLNKELPSPPPVDVHQDAMARTCVGLNPMNRLQVYLWLDGEALVHNAMAEMAAVVAHEAVHAALGIFEARGLTVTHAGEEALTYYVEWISVEALWFFWKSHKRG